MGVRFKANKEDWEAIYQLSMDDREQMIDKLKNKQKIRKSRWRRITLNRISPVPTITSIKEAISGYYKGSHKIKPKAKLTKESTYKYWDEVKNTPLLEEDDITNDDLLKQYMER